MNARVSRLLMMVRICLGLAVMWGLCGCEGDGKDVSGDSNLLITNSRSTILSVEFDGDFIGTVNDDSRRWKVPSGRHEVKVTEPRDLVSTRVLTHRSFDFAPGETVEINE
jgi:hypothetical protein